MKKHNMNEEHKNNIDIEKTAGENENAAETNSEKKEEPRNMDGQIANELNTALEKAIELEKQNKELKDTLLRKAAEFENYKRRTENDQMNLIKYAAENFISNILPVYDDLERSLDHIDDENNFESTKKGLKLVFEKFTKVLDSQGVKKIDAEGKPFDFNYHEALMQQSVSGIPSHTVLKVVEPGYIYKDKVLKHAKVIVSQEIVESPDEGANENGKEEN